MLSASSLDYLKVQTADVLSSTSLTYAFYANAGQLGGYYSAGMTIPYATAANTTPTYTSVFTALTPSQQSDIGFDLANKLGFSDLTFTSGTVGSADLHFAAINVNTPYQAAPAAPSTTPGAYAWAGPPSDPTVSGDAWFTPDGLAAGVWEQAKLHEIGHLLGLQHNTESQKLSIMTTGTSPARLDEFQILDIAALQYMYGASNQNSGNTSYTTSNFVTATSDRFWSLWDSGGVDTLDLSGFGQSQKIDLRPGYFSSLGDDPGVSVSGTSFTDGQENMSVAFGSEIENAIGSWNSDIIIGNAFSNNIQGGEGDDVIYGDGTTLLSTTGMDAEYATFDKSSYQTFTIDMSVQRDTLNGGDGDDTIFGGLGGDVIRGGADADTLYGRAGDDKILVGEGQDVSADGGSGHDVLSFEKASAGVTVNLTDSMPALLGVSISSFEEYHFTDHDDVISTTQVSGSVINGLGGSDAITGGIGNDNIDGGDGDDDLHGGDGDDMIKSGRNDVGFDTLYGGEDNDTLLSGEGYAFLSGDEGSDILISGGKASIDGGDGDDHIHLELGGGNGYGGQGADTYYIATGTGIDGQWMPLIDDSYSTETNVFKFDSQILGELNFDGQGTLSATVDRGNGEFYAYYSFADTDIAGVDAITWAYWNGSSWDLELDLVTSASMDQFSDMESEYYQDQNVLIDGQLAAIQVVGLWSDYGIESTLGGYSDFWYGSYGIDTLNPYIGA